MTQAASIMAWEGWRSPEIILAICDGMKMAVAAPFGDGHARPPGSSFSFAKKIFRDFSEMC
ncbi:MAG TPA: hypothetical protein VKC56_07605 [Gallionellaceae bacterium]|nr:hypothetical protein [Gallionellaceae bacterium]